MTKQRTLYAWATVELTALEPGDPPLAPIRDDNGRQVHHIYRRGDVIPTHLFAEYIPSPGMAVTHSGIDDLIAAGSIGWEPPGAEPVPDGDWYEIRYKDGTTVQVQGPPPDPATLQVMSGERIQQIETATQEAN